MQLGGTVGWERQERTLKELICLPIVRTERFKHSFINYAKLNIITN